MKNDNLIKELKLEGSKKNEKSKNLQSNRVNNFSQEELKYNMENLSYENLNLDFLNFDKVKTKINQIKLQIVE